jgi:hypothetical protein
VWFAALALLAPIGCQLETSWRPKTQTVIDLDADASVRARTQSLRVVITGSDQRGQLTGDAEPSLDEVLTFGADEDVHWPLRFVLEPPRGDFSRLFALTASARDDHSQVLAQVRVASGYVSGQVRHLALRFDEACVRVTCGDDQTCSGGDCRDAWIAPADTPLFVDKPGVADAAAADGGSAPLPDAAMSVSGDEDDAGQVQTATAPSRDPCANANGGCDVLVSCQVLFGVPICGVCPSGYDDVNGDVSSCRDRDECQMNNGGCDPEHGVCTNTPGGRECRCKQGYHDDGERCLQQIPCSSDAFCGQHARCSAIDGARVCVCGAGYAGDGTNCTDIDECATRQAECGEHARCVNNDGGFDCQCESGYVLQDGACREYDECKAGSDDCDDQPEACVNDPGGFHCSCPSGYTGDGKGAMGCADIDECQQNTDGCSSAPEACVNDVGAFHCQCPAGYVGDGKGPSGCTPVNECVMHTDNCDRAPDACVDDVVGFHCQCPSGYSGTGVGDSGCSDIDECATSNGGCDPMRQCINTDGSARCGDCAAGFGTSGASACVKCACYEQGGADACTSKNEAAPAASAHALTGQASIPAHTLFGYQITLPANARVSSFGAYKKGGASITISIGLYADVNGQPATRMAQTAPAQFAGSPLSAAPVAGVDGCLAAGTYWLIGVSDSDLAIGQDTGAGVPSVRLGLPRLSSDELPANWPSGSTTTSEPPLNLYLTIDHP